MNHRLIEFYKNTFCVDESTGLARLNLYPGMYDHDTLFVISQIEGKSIVACNAEIRKEFEAQYHIVWNGSHSVEFIYDFLNWNKIKFKKKHMVLGSLDCIHCEINVNVKQVKEADEFFQGLQKNFDYEKWCKFCSVPENGYYFAYKRDNIFLSTAYYSFNICGIGNIVVNTLPNERRKGYAKHVVEALINWGKVNNISSLYRVNIENIPSLNFAKTLQFNFCMKEVVIQRC